MQALDGALHVIIVVHADLTDRLFRDRVIERWRHSNNQALVPPEWITDSDPRLTTAPVGRAKMATTRASKCLSDERSHRRVAWM